jgi:hypothetical protein
MKIVGVMMVKILLITVDVKIMEHGIVLKKNVRILRHGLVIVSKVGNEL